MADHKKAIQNTEGERRDCEESIAAIASRWFLRNAIQCLAGSGFLGPLRPHRETVVSMQSPWRAPQSFHRELRPSKKYPGPPCVPVFPSLSSSHWNCLSEQKAE